MGEDQDNGDGRRSTIRRFNGHAPDYSAWIHSVKLHAMATGCDDVLSNTDNPYKRERRRQPEEVDIGADTEANIFAEDGEKITRPSESPEDFAKVKLSWSKRRNRLFADIGKSLKGSTEGFSRQVKSGDVQGLLKLVSDGYGDTTEASRYALIMEMILLRLEKPGNLDKHILKFTDLKRRLGSLKPPERLTDGAETCLFIHSISNCEEFKGLVEAALLQDKKDDQTMTLKQAVSLTREFAANKIVAASESGVSAFRVQDAEKPKKGRFNGKCHYCKKNGHKSQDCRKRKRDEAGSTGSGDEPDKGNGERKRSRFTVRSVAVSSLRVASAKTKPVKHNAGYHELILDSGAARHCIKERELLTDTNPCAVELIVASGDESTAKSSGTLTGLFNPGAATDEMEGAFEGALHTPGFDRSLLSAMSIYKNNGTVHLEKGNCYFKPTRANLKVEVKVRGDDFVVPVKAVPSNVARVQPVATSEQPVTTREQPVTGGDRPGKSKKRSRMFARHVAEYQQFVNSRPSVDFVEEEEESEEDEEIGS